MAFYDKVGAILRHNIAAQSALSGKTSMFNVIPCMSTRLFIKDSFMELMTSLGRMPFPIKGTAVTKVKMDEKEAQGVAEKIVINVCQVVICVIASQIAILGESIMGVVFQEKLNNDAVNVINISIGSILAIFIQQLLLQSLLA